MSDRDSNHFYIGIYRFPADPQRERTVLLEEIHPVVYQIAYPNALMREHEPILVSWTQVSPEQAEGPWNAYLAADRQGDIVTIEDVYTELVKLHSDAEAVERGGTVAYLDSKIKAVEAYAEASGHPLPGNTGPRP